jgi:hypothetical protein
MPRVRIGEVGGLSSHGEKVGRVWDSFPVRNWVTDWPHRKGPFAARRPFGHCLTLAALADKIGLFAASECHERAAKPAATAIVAGTAAAAAAAIYSAGCCERGLDTGSNSAAATATSRFHATPAAADLSAATGRAAEKKRDALGSWRLRLPDVDCHHHRRHLFCDLPR